MTIKEVYEKWKGYDCVLSDEELLHRDIKGAAAQALFDLWQAVKETSE